jgi:hypothetical protein
MAEGPAFPRIVAIEPPDTNRGEHPGAAPCHEGADQRGDYRARTGRV